MCISLDIFNISQFSYKFVYATLWYEMNFHRVSNVFLLILCFHLSKANDWLRHIVFCHIAISSYHISRYRFLHVQLTSHTTKSNRLYTVLISFVELNRDSIKKYSHLYILDASNNIIWYSHQHNYDFLHIKKIDMVNN